MIIWFIFAVLTACVILAIVRPLAEAKTAAPDSEQDIQVYKLQLAELERDAERGTLNADEVAQSRTEIARRILRARKQANAGERFVAGRVNGNAALVAISVVIAVATLGLYANFGAPGLPDQPLQARLDAPPAEQSLDIQIANVERRLRSHPDDAAGWAVIAPVYFRTGQYEKAAEAFRKAMALSGEDENKLLGFAESLTFANNGVIPEPAKAAMAEAVKQKPKSLRGRFWMAVLAEQDGNKQEAEHIFRTMLAENIPEAWRKIALERLASLNAPGEDRQSSADLQSADALQGNQGEMIRGMVARLADRLKENGDDLQGWLRLIRSYAVLKEFGKAEEATESARRQFASNAEALDQIAALGQEVGIGRQAPAGSAESDQSALVRGMVERLAARLKESKDDIDGWLMLIRSYTVLKETAKAQDAAAAARNQFAADAQALERIDALAHELGLGAGDTPGGHPKS
jgi:cytochrome c-type biogenesis protein CcmH